MVPIVGAVVALVVVLGALVILRGSYRAVPAGKALVISTTREQVVARTGRVVLPIVHRAEEIDLSVHTIEVHRRGKEGVICADNIRADVRVKFLVRIGQATDDILRVAQSIGCARATQRETLEELFEAKFAEAIKTVGRHLEFEQLFTQRSEFKDRIIEVIGRDLNGYVLDDAIIDDLEQTPLAVLDPNNVLDALGIEKIQRITRAAEVEATKHAYAIRTAQAKRPRVEAVDPPLPLELELHEIGLLDVRVACEVGCDLPGDRPALTVHLDEDALARLPKSITPAQLRAIGAAELTCAEGRATLRWDAHAEREQLIAGARLVHALRDEDRAYR